MNRKKIGRSVGRSMKQVEVSRVNSDSGRHMVSPETEQKKGDG